jgi:hypothetical protein
MSGRLGAALMAIEGYLDEDSVSSASRLPAQAAAGPRPAR